MTTNEHECPDCGGPMILRVNRKNNTEFMGCARYPKCTGTKNLADPREVADEMPSDRYRRADRQRWRDE